MILPVPQPHIPIGNEKQDEYSFFGKTWFDMSPIPGLSGKSLCIGLHAMRILSIESPHINSIAVHVSEGP